MPEGPSVITTEGPRFITMEEAKELFATKLILPTWKLESSSGRQA